MARRIDYHTEMPQALQAMLSLQKVVDDAGLDPKLVELVKIRASQLNGCAYCLDMHSKDAVAIGENPQRIYVLAAWREAPFFSDEERAALAWAEALTQLPEMGAPDRLYHDLELRFSAKEIVALTFAIVAINGWNRLAVGLGSEVGSYQSNRHPVGVEAGR